MFRTLIRYCLLIPALLATMMATSTELQGQEAPVVWAGERVRLWAPDAIEGRVIRSTADTIVLEAKTSGRVVAVSGREIEKFERRVPAGRHTATGAGLGLLAGVGGAAMAATDCREGIFTYSDCFVLASLLLVPAGTVLGAVIGHAIPRESWREFRLPARSGIVLDPRSGVGLSISVTF